MDFKKTLDIQYRSWLRTLPDIRETLCSFSDRNSNHDRADFMLSLFKSANFKLLLTSLGKNSKESEVLRELGNKNYKGLLVDVAISNYSSSIAHAPTNSHELAVAFGNRAACLMHINDYPSALNDVVKALEVSSIDEDYKLKLFHRKAKCLLKEKEPGTQEWPDDLVPMLHSQSLYFKSASDKIKLSDCSELGRHLVASKSINTGEILIVEKPYSRILLSSCWFTHCTHCLKACHSLLCCPSCSSSMFCSQTCLEFANKSYHVIECKILEKLVNLEIGKMGLLALRILIDASSREKGLKSFQNLMDIKNAGKNKSYESDDLLRLFQLIGNDEKRKQDDLFYRTFTACSIVMILSDYTCFFENFMSSKSLAAGVLLQLLQSLPCNAHEISDFQNNELVEIGAGAYATLSLLNHSCDPNAVRHSLGEIVILRALKTINCGEEIVDNYGYHYATHGYNERQTSLSQQYYFDCRCEACVNSWPLYNDLPKKNPIFKRPHKEAEYQNLTSKFEELLFLLSNNEVSETMLDTFCDYLDFLDDNIVRPWQKYNDCQEAIKHGLNFLPNYNRVKLN